MSRPTARVVLYRLRTTMPRRWGGYLSLIVLIGLIGGIAMGSVAAARRTQSSYAIYLASTNPSDLTVSTYGTGPSSTANGYSAALTGRIARLGLVWHLTSWVGLYGAPLRPDGAPDLSAGADVNAAGSVDGLYFTQDRAKAVQGRMSDPTRPDELVMTAAAARLQGLHLGQTVAMGFYGTNQAALPGFGTARVPPQIRVQMRLVGIVVFSTDVVQDDTDRYPTNELFTPALTDQLAGADNSQGTWYGLQLVHGNRDVPVVEQEVTRLLPRGSVANFAVTARQEAKVERAIKPESIALGAFGAIAGLAALAVALQLISRLLRSADDDLAVLRALGAGPTMTMGDGVTGVLGAVVAGSVVAAAVVVALSPIAPLGPVRPVYPSPGVAADWTVLGAGLLLLVVGLGLVTVLLAFLGSPQRRAGRSQAPGGTSTAARVVLASGLPPAALIGVRMALEPGGGRNRVPVRSALSGALLAVGLVTATLTFGSGLQTLVSHPALYGWNWTYALTSVNDIPPQARTLLSHDRAVTGWSGYLDVDFQIDGSNTPALLGGINQSVSPPVLSGHGLEAGNQIVLGPATLAQLHKQIGDTVTASFGTPNQAPVYIPPTRLRIVGTATLPAVVAASTLADHVSMGIGALIPTAMMPGQIQAATSGPDPTLNGPPLVFVRMAAGPTPAGWADMQRIARAANAAFAADPQGAGDAVAVVPVQRPAEIVNYRSTGSTPFLLATGLAGGAVLALTLTLTASVRRRRHDLALLKTLGFTQGQLAAAVAWQASTAAVVGMVGLPLGIAAGRWLWTLFAREIYAVPRPTVPWTVVLVAVGALVLANVVAAVPGRMAARTPAALALRDE